MSRAMPELKAFAKKVSASPKIALIREFRIGSNASPRPASAKVGGAALVMDHKAFRKMKSGKLSPEARIDLHGLTLAQAQPQLMRFIQDSAAQGRRLVLVITGKGRASRDDGPIPTRPGALRHQVPFWLHSPSLKPLVLQTSEANQKHGGQGAIYVYLRRSRG